MYICVVGTENPQELKKQINELIKESKGDICLIEDGSKTDFASHCGSCEVNKDCKEQTIQIVFHKDNLSPDMKIEIGVGGSRCQCCELF